MQFQVDAAVLTGFVLALVRASAWIFFAPPFNNRAIPARVKAGIAAALALAIAPMLAEQGVGLGNGEFFGALVTQLVVGFGLAFVTQLLVAALQAAGSLIDMFAGFSLATVYDPMADSSAAVFGRFYQLLAITLLFALDGHVLLVRGFIGSFHAIGANGFQANEFGRLLTRDLGIFFVSAIEVAAPVLAVLFLTEVGMGLLSRAAPAMNVFALAFPIRIVVSLVLVSASLPLLVPGIESLLDHVSNAVGLR
ncbi:MAG: flagellar biosynthetic protein FliR [Acidimicrobiia bacterium]